MIESRLFLYTAIAVLSLSFTVLGYFSLASSPHFGAILGFLSGGALSALLSQNILMFQDYHKRLQSYLRQRDNELLQIEESMNNIEALNLQEIQKHYSSELQTLSQRNDSQKQIIEQLEALYVALKAWSNEVSDITETEAEDVQENVHEEPPVVEKNTDKIVQPDASITSTNQNTQVPQHLQLHQSLKSKEAELLAFETTYSVGTSLRKIGEFMNDNYAAVSEFLIKARNCVLTENYNGFELNLDGKSKRDLFTINNLGDRLRRENILDYKYRRKANSKSARVASLRVENSDFLTETWLKFAIHRKITRFFTEKHISNNLVINAKIHTAYEQIFDIDFFGLVNVYLLFIKCQVIANEDDVASYAKFCQYFDINPHLVYFISPEVTQQTATSLTAKYQVQVVNSCQFIEVLEENMKFFTN